MSQLNKYFLIIVIVLSSFVYGQKDSENLTFTATIKPVRLIIEGLVKKRARVVQLVPTGVSPHHFEPLPGSLKDLGNSKACFYISTTMEPWISFLDQPNSFSIVNMLPEASLLNVKISAFGSDPAHADPHFWTDPATIISLLPALKKVLIDIDPKGRDIYENNYSTLVKSLTALNDRVRMAIGKIKSGPFILSHPFFNYFLVQNEIEIAGIISPAGEIQPSPLKIARLIKMVPQKGVTAVLTMPEQSQLGARTVAESTSIPEVILDPLGNRRELGTIVELLDYNIGKILELPDAR